MRTKRQIPGVCLIVILLLLALAIWVRVSASKMPPLYDGLSYAYKAYNFWVAVSQRNWFNPLNIEPVGRAPGTVLFSYPLGWTPDFRSYYFNLLFSPIAIFVTALWLIGRPFCDTLREIGVLAALCTALATLPIFYHFEPNPELTDTISLGQMDVALAAVAALAVALTIRGAWKLDLSWTITGLGASVFLIFIKPAGAVVMGLVFVSWAVHTTFLFWHADVEGKRIWKYGAKACAAFLISYGFTAFFCRNSRYLSVETIESAKAVLAILQSEFGPSRIRDLLLLTWRLLSISLGWQGLVLITATFAAVIRAFVKRDRSKLQIWVPGIIASIASLIVGGYFWLFLAGAPEIRYFFPFLAISLTVLFPSLLDLTHSLAKWRFLPVLIALSIPLPLLTALLMIGHPPIALQKALRVNLTTGGNSEEINTAHALVTKARAENRELSVYSAGYDTINGIFMCVGMYETLIAPQKKSFVTRMPVTWTGPSTFLLDEIINSDYLLFTPIPNQMQANNFLSELKTVEDFWKELSIFRAWLTTADPSTGLVLEKQMPRLRLYKVVDREKLQDALMTLLRSHRWRKTFYATNGSKWFTGSDTIPQANATPESVTLAAGKSLTFTSANGFEGIQGLANVTVSRTADGLRIHALNGDPQIILPTIEGVMPGNKLTVHVQLVSPDRTEFQIFYGTSAASEFDEAHSVRKPIQKGDNDVMVEFTEPDFKGRIRLDPGMLPGDYIPKLVEVRSSPAP